MGLYDRQYYREPDGQMSFSVNGQSATMLLVYINAAIFLFDWLFQVDLAQWFGLQGDTLFKPWLWFQYLTYGFLHAITGDHALWHVLGNMFMLWMFGRMVEQHYGKAEFLRIYLLSVIVSGAVWNVALLAMTGGEQQAVLVGASGAVSTIFTLFVCLYPKVTILLWFVIPVPAWALGVFVLVMNLLGQDSSVAYTAHLAGIGLGLAYFFGGLNLGRFSPGAIRIPRWRGRSRPRLRIHSEDEDRDPYNDSDEEAERILDKVREKGMESLTESERRKLEAYSRRMRQKLS